MRNHLFATRCKQLLRQKGLSLRNIEEKLNLPKSTLHDYLSGSRSPTLDKVAALADLLEVSPAYLAGWCEFPQLPCPAAFEAAGTLREIQSTPAEAPNKPAGAVSAADNKVPSEPSENAAASDSGGRSGGFRDFSDLIHNAEARKR